MPLLWHHSNFLQSEDAPSTVVWKEGGQSPQDPPRAPLSVSLQRAVWLDTGSLIFDIVMTAIMVLFAFEITVNVIVLYDECPEQHLMFRETQRGRREGVELLKDLHSVLKNPLKKPSTPSEEAAHLLFPLLNTAS